MAKEFFKNLPDTSTPLTSSRINGFLNGEESIGNIVVGDISSKNLLDIGFYEKFNDFAFPNVFEYLDDGWMHYVNNVGIHEGLQFLSFKVKPNTKYVIKIEFADKTGSPIVMFRQRTGDTTVLTEYLYSSAVKTTESNTDNVLMALTTDSLNSQANSKVRIMVCEGDDTSVEYTPHINFRNEGIYSLGEIKIGTWIDGKPLYRKVIDFGTLPNNEEKSYNINGLNVSTIVNAYGFAMSPDGNYGYQIPFVNPRGTVYEGIGLYKNQNYIVVITGIDRSGYSAYITLEYTKTTD